MLLHNTMGKAGDYFYLGPTEVTGMVTHFCANKLMLCYLTAIESPYTNGLRNVRSKLVAERMAYCYWQLKYLPILSSVSVQGNNYFFFLSRILALWDKKNDNR